jgi:DNA-binding transcriptional LysR family regulator
MELRHIRSFIAVAEELSFRRAAKRLHLTQAPLSRQIQALEADLGVTLLERYRGRKVALTDAGRIFFVDARRALDAVEVARHHTQEFARNTPDRLVIASYSALSARMLPAVLKKFRARFPKVEVSIVELNGKEEFAALREGRVHLALVVDYHLELEPCFQSESLFGVSLLALFPAGHRLARRRAAEIPLRALAQEALLYKNEEHTPCYTRGLPEICRLAGITPHALHGVDGFDNVLAMVAAGYGVGVVPDAFDGSLDPTFKAKRLRLPAAMPPFQQHMVWRRDCASVALHHFLDIVRLSAKSIQQNQARREHVKLKQ